MRNVSLSSNLTCYGVVMRTEEITTGRARSVGFMQVGTSGYVDELAFAKETVWIPTKWYDPFGLIWMEKKTNYFVSVVGGLTIYPYDEAILLTRTKEGFVVEFHGHPAKEITRNWRDVTGREFLPHARPFDAVYMPIKVNLG